MINPPLNKPYEGDKNSDTGGDSVFQIAGDGIDQNFSKLENGKENQNNSGNENGAQSGLPGDLLNDHHRVGKIKLMPIPGARAMG